MGIPLGRSAAISSSSRWCGRLNTLADGHPLGTTGYGDAITAKSGKSQYPRRWASPWDLRCPMSTSNTSATRLNTLADGHPLGTMTRLQQKGEQDRLSQYPRRWASPWDARYFAPLSMTAASLNTLADGHPLGTSWPRMFAIVTITVSIPSQMGIPLGLNPSHRCTVLAVLSQYPRRWASPWDDRYSLLRSRGGAVSIPSQMGIPLGPEKKEG